jgi:hypothetical protein
MDSNNAAGGALDQLGGVLGECEKGATGFDHNCLSEEECTVAIWHRRELPSTGQMAGFRNWRLHRKNSQGREARPPTDGAGEIPRLARKAHNVAAGSSR